MKYLERLLKGKEKELERILETVTDYLKDAPEGRLRINHNQKGVQYYYCKKSEEDEKYKGNGHFIRKEERGIVQKLAQKSYFEKVAVAADKQIKAIRRFLQSYDEQELEGLYLKMAEERRKLVYPVIIPDKMYIDNWKQKTNSGQNDYPITGEIYTENGEHVRSKSEKILADKFALLGIPYKYEQRLELKDNTQIYPDFTLLNIHTRQEIYYEHFGMMDNQEYAEKAWKKIDLYEKNGIFLGKQLLCSFETQTTPLDIRSVERKIKIFFT